jgi:type II restriction enzyme
MLGLIRAGKAPNLFLLHYDRPTWRARNLVLVPRFVFTESAIERRAPLSGTARRHGHILCNIVLANLPQDARIPLIVEGQVQEPGTARRFYERLRPFQRLRLQARGWTLDVLNVVHRLRKTEFSLDEVYGFAEELQELHPRNRNVEPKIRQQLQRLRDLGFLEFLGPGRYRLRR